MKQAPILSEPVGLAWWASSARPIGHDVERGPVGPRGGLVLADVQRLRELFGLDQAGVAR